MKFRLLLAAVVAASLTSISAMAGAPLTQEQLKQRAEAAQKALDQAEAAKGGERKKRMDEHMKLMNEVLGQMIEMKPRPGMTMEEHETWINTHQKLMEQLMGQMMREHHLMMEKGCD